MTNALVDHGGFPLWAVINWSLSFLRTRAVHYSVSWLWSTSLWIDSHAIAYCLLFLLLPVLCTIFKCTSRVIFFIATIAVSRWTNRCPHCCCIWPGGALVEAPAVWLDSAPIAPGRSVSEAMSCCCGKVRKMHQQNVKWFRSHNSTTQLFWIATPILPEPPRSSQKGWMQNNVLLRYSASTFKCSSMLLK